MIVECEKFKDFWVGCARK